MMIKKSNKNNVICWHCLKPVRFKTLKKYKNILESQYINCPYCHTRVVIPGGEKNENTN